MSYKHDHDKDDKCKKHEPSCKSGKGTILRLFIPPGAEINLLGLIEVSSPTGICLIISLPFIKGCPNDSKLSSLIDAFRDAGATIEVVKS